MANILYRSGAAGATTFSVASTNGSVARPLTNVEIDGNFYALDQGPTVGTTQLKPNVTYSTLSGLTSVTATTFYGSLNGNAANVTTNANLTGDVTSVGNATTLATVNTNVGTFNSVTVNAKGLVTAASNVNTVTAAFQFSDTTQSTSSSTGGVTMLGGLGVAKNIYAGGNIFGANLSGTNTGDQTLPTTLPASDVYAWAKASVKPSYNFSEISSSTISATTGTFSGAISASNLSGTNTGDETLATIKTKLGITTLSGSNTGDQTLPTTLPHNGTALSATTGTFSNVTDSTSSTTGAVTIVGGLGVAKSIYAGLTISAVGNITSTSDSRFKTNLQRITSALSKVNQLNGYTFDRTDIETSRQTGVIAQEVLLVLPEAVTGTKDAYSVAYGNMMGLMIEAIKELNAKVTDLQNQLTINK